MKRFRFVLASLLVLVSAAGLRANLGASLQMQLGNPSGATADPNNHTKYLLQRAQYAIDYNDTTREANWVAWNLTTTDVGGSGRSDFSVDSTLPPGFTAVLTTDYSGSGFDRGHMCPSGDRTVTVADNQVTFYMSNMVPQAPDNNQGVWANFESHCRTLAGAGNELLIISGPGGFAGSNLATGVAVPGFVWKIAVIVPLGPGTAQSRITPATRVIAIKIPNVQGVRNNPWQNYITSAAQIETDTGLTFFTDLPAATAGALRVKVDGQTAVGAPSITTQPSGQVAALGGSATFTVTASGDPTLLYQWLKDDVELTGATTSSLNLVNLQASDVATYTVIVSNSIGSVTSAGAALVITGIAPSIVTSPAPRTAAAGTNTIFSVSATGSPTLTFQWRKGSVPLANGGNVSGATSATLLLSNLQAADAENYDVVVTNSVNSATSASAALTVTAAAPSITSPPSSQTVAIGGTAIFTVSATGTNPFSYQWRKGGIPLSDGGSISGANSATLTLVNVQNSDVGSYDVVVSNGVAPDATSPVASLTVTAVAAGRLSYAGGTYIQNFDTLPVSGSITFPGLTAPFDLAAAPANAGGMTGWSLAATAGTPALTAGTGTSNAGAVYSYGAAGSPERALGTVASGTVSPRFGLTLVNTTGVTITQFTLSYVGEWWRNGGNASLATHALPFSYAVGANDISSSSPAFTPVAALGFTSPTPTSATAAAVDGNVTSNRVTILSTVSGLNWAPGQTLVLRWDDINDTGNDHGLAIDDLTFSTLVAAPPPPPVAPVIVSTIPAAGASAVSTNAPVSITFAQPVTVAGSWFSLTSALNGAVAATVTVSPDAKTFTLIPPIGFADNDTITVTVFASQIVDQASGTLHPAGNTVFSFTTAAPVAPSIVTQPLPQTVAAGTSASFSVVAGGTAPFSYQWRKGGVAISGNPSAATSTLTLTNVQAADVAAYDVVVTNGINPAATSNAVGLTVTAVAGNQVNFGGGTYMQNFDTLPAAGAFTFVGTGPFAFNAAPVNAGGLPGWSFAKYAGSGANALFKPDTGSSNAGGVNSYGAAAATDRALGSLSSGTAISRFGVTLVNTSGAAITYFTLRYTGEQWRHGGVTTPNKLAFAYAVAASDINAANFTGVAALDFTAPIATTTTAALDGNAAANRVTVSGTVSGLNWAPGQTLTLRWTDVDDAGADDGLAIDDLVFTTTTLTALVRHAPVVSGSIDGTVQMLLGENVALNGTAWISGDLLVPGTPNVILNGTPTYGGTLDGVGSTSPAGYSVTLSGASLLRHVLRRTDPIAMPTVAAPPAPTGSRVVSLTSPGQNPGDFTTLRNLSLNAAAGPVTVPPGTYGSFSASGNSGFVLGVPGASVPAVYNFQSLALNLLPGTAQLQIVGPVIINLANGSLMNGNSGSPVHPEWLTLNVAAGSLTISGNVTFHGRVVAPTATITLNGNAVVNGSVVADRLTLNGASALKDPQ